MTLKQPFLVQNCQKTVHSSKECVLYKNRQQTAFANRKNALHAWSNGRKVRASPHGNPQNRFLRDCTTLKTIRLAKRFDSIKQNGKQQPPSRGRSYGCRCRTSRAPTGCRYYPMYRTKVPDRVGYDYAVLGIGSGRVGSGSH